MEFYALFRRIGCLFYSSSENVIPRLGLIDIFRGTPRLISTVQSLDNAYLGTKIPSCQARMFCQFLRL
jgi:hypothetical protein